MSPFHNYQDVHNQAGVQTNNGPIHHGPSYFGNVYMSNVPCLPTNATDQAKPLAKLDKDILESLSFPEMFERRNQIEHAHSGTCEWVTHTDGFQAWNNQVQGLLWIRGKPGAGKSTLMTFLYHRMKDMEVSPDDKDVVLDFFFDSNGTELQKTPVGMFRSLLNQLFSRVESVRPRMRRIFEQRTIAFGSGQQTWNWHQRELETHFRYALTEAVRSHRVIIQIDALNESGEANAADIANYLQQLDKKLKSIGHGTVQIIVSSRHFPIIAQAKGIEIVVETHNVHDIFKYVEDRLLPIIQSSGMTESSSGDIWAEMVTSVAQRSAGVFQWVRQIIPMIERAVAEGEGFNSILNKLQDIPAALNQLYEHILLHGIRPENRAESCVIFQWVCLTERLFSLNELRRALSFENEALPLSQRRYASIPSFHGNNKLMKLRINVLSGGLIEAIFDSERKEELARIIHQSAHSYLISCGLSKLMTLSEIFNPVTMDGGNHAPEKMVSYCHRNLFSACVRYLANEDLAMDLPETTNTMERAKYLRDELGKPWLDYAVLYMLVHAEKAGEWLNDTCAELVSLLQRVYIGWLRLHRFLDSRSVQCLGMKSSLMHVAAAKNLAAILKMLAGNSWYSLNAIDENLDTPLHLAARFGHDECVKVLVEAGANLYIRNKTNYTAIEVAARCGNLAIMRAALSQKGSEMFRAIYSQSMMEPRSEIYAARVMAHGYTSADSYPPSLHSRSASISHGEKNYTLNEWPEDGDLYKSAFETHIVPLFPHSPASRSNWSNNTNAVGDFSQFNHWSPLYIATSQNDFNMVREMLDLLAHLTNLSERESRLPLALQIASFEGHIDVVRLLLAQDVDVNAPGGRLGTALDAAISMNNHEVVTLLLIASAQQKAKKVQDIAKSIETELFSQQRLGKI